MHDIFFVSPASCQLLSANYLSVQLAAGLYLSEQGERLLECSTTYTQGLGVEGIGYGIEIMEMSW